MKRLHIAALCTVLLVASALCGCKKNSADLDSIRHFVETVNAHPDRELPNGTILSRCDYAPGDSLLVYRIRVADGRFDGKDIDSIKSRLREDLLSPDMHRLTSLLKRNNIGIQYVYTTAASDIVVTFGPGELGSTANQ